MRQALQKTFGFIKGNLSILFSLSLIILLPLGLWWDTSVTVNAFQNNVNQILQTKALTIENIMSQALLDKLGSSQLLQQAITQAAHDNADLKDIKVITLQADKFRIVAAQNKNEIGKMVADPSLNLAWYQNQNIAYLSRQRGGRFWNLVKPIYDNGKKVGLISMSLSLKDTDALIAQTVQRSYLLIILLTLMSLFLIFQHTRLFGYLSLSKELKQRGLVMQSFIRMATHELLTPITNIRAYIEALDDEIGPSLNKEQRMYLDRVAISAKSLVALATDILEVARLERGALDTTPQPVQPQKIVQELVDAFQPKAKEAHLQLLYSPKDLGVTIMVNPNRFHEIVQNLISNALKYTKKGKVELKEWIDPYKHMYYLSCEDTGIGISGEEQKKLFTQFYRVKNKDTVGVPGTGLGLWISKNLCLKMGGNINLESIRGVGTKFVVNFPAKTLKKT